MAKELNLPRPDAPPVEAAPSRAQHLLSGELAQALTGPSTVAAAISDHLSTIKTINASVQLPTVELVRALTVPSTVVAAISDHLSAIKGISASVQLPPSGGRHALDQVPSATAQVAVSAPADLGALVRKARERRKMTQQAFADLCGVGRRFLSELENGKPTVEFGKVLQVLAAAGIDLTARERQ